MDAVTSGSIARWVLGCKSQGIIGRSSDMLQKVLKAGLSSVSPRCRLRSVGSLPGSAPFARSFEGRWTATSPAEYAMRAG